MLTKPLARIVTLACALIASPALWAGPADPELLTQLSASAPRLNPDVLELALSALNCAEGDALPDTRLAVIDYSLPSTEPRMWVFDLSSRSLLFEELVAHGRQSGNTRSTAFSNIPGSHQSSIGLFRTLQTYHGRNGYSLRMQGLEPRFNHRALDRAIVIHGAPYVSPEFIRQTGRIGRSHGCPAVSEAAAKPLINSLQDGSYVFSYYPDPDYLAGSQYLNCPQQLAMK